MGLLSALSLGAVRVLSLFDSCVALVFPLCWSLGLLLVPGSLLLVHGPWVCSLAGCRRFGGPLG